MNALNSIVSSFGLSINFNNLSYFTIALALIFVFRIVQRIYYFSRGHQQYFTEYLPSNDLDAFFKVNSISVKDTSVVSGDGVKLKYRIIGEGKKIIYLANGVGTDLFMWLPIIKAAFLLYPNLFKEITLYAPSYRGIFGCVRHGIDISQPYDDRDSQNVIVTLDKCGDDVVDIMKHAGLKKLDMIVCWSLGAQMSISCVAKHKIQVGKLFLMNPAIGNTVQKALQPFIPLPVFIQKIIGKSAIALLTSLKTILKYDAWFILKKASNSLGLRLFLEILSFTGGFPPEQAPFFQQYMRDAFSSQYHTRGLLDLIISLDAPCTSAALSLTCPTIVLSGMPDFMTGIYNSYELLRTMPQAKHVVFTMASHFLLLEWPDLVAKELIQFIFE